MNADDFRIGVFHGDEDIGPTLPRNSDDLHHVCSPHFIDPVGDDRSIVRLTIGASNAMRSEQAVVAHRAFARGGGLRERQQSAIAPITCGTPHREGVRQLFAGGYRRPIPSSEHAPTGPGRWAIVFGSIYLRER